MGTCARIYSPSVTYYTVLSSYLDAVVREDMHRPSLQAFASAAINPKTKCPYPLRQQRQLYTVLVRGLAGSEHRASGHIERYFSGFTLLQHARVRRVGEGCAFGLQDAFADTSIHCTA